MVGTTMMSGCPNCKERALRDIVEMARDIEAALALRWQSERSVARGVILVV